MWGSRLLRWPDGLANSPEVIHRRYHGCIDRHEEAANTKIAKALEEDGDAA